MQAALFAVVSVVGQTGLADRLPPKIKQGHVWNWLYRDKKTPPEYCLEVAGVARENGVDVTEHDLRSDVFGERPDEADVA